MPSPVVSVIVPARDAADTLGEALDSLISQSFDAWEAVVVENHSGDTTRAVAERYAASDGRIRTMTIAAPAQGAARNAGLRAATSEWLLFLDADDWLLPRGLELLLAGAEDRTDVVHAGWVRVLPQAGELEPEFAPPGDVFATLACRPAFAINAALARRTAVEEAGGFDEDLPVCEDWDLWQRIARAGARFAAVPEVVARTRLGPGAAAADPARLLRHGLRVIDRGHAPDPRVRNPDPSRAQGAPRARRAGARLAFASLAAGYAIGAGHDPTELLAQVGDTSEPGLDPGTVAAGLVQGVPLGAYETPAAWPELWDGAQQSVDALLRALERRSGAPFLGARARPRLERMAAEHAAGAPTATVGGTRALEIDLEQASRGVELHGELRLLLWPTFAGTRLATVELPVCDGVVHEQVIADAVAARHFWALLGRFFARTVYRGHDAGADEFHDRIGWEVFLQELWGLPDWPNERFYRQVERPQPRAGLRQRYLPARLRAWLDRGWRHAEVAAELPDLTIHGSACDVVVTVGGAPLGVLRVEGPGRVGAEELRRLITIGGGLELCRLAVREAVLGRPATAPGSLRERLRDAARRRPAREVPSGPAGFALAPVATPPEAVSTLVLPRHAGGRVGTSTSRRATLPSAAAADLEQAAHAAGEPVLGGARAGPPGRVVYAPEILWRAAGRPAAGELRPDSSQDVATGSPADAWDVGRPNDRHRFETLFAAHEDPWDYASPYEQAKYDLTLALLPDAPIGRALELACAEGHFTVQLAPRVGQLTAADISKVALERASRRCSGLDNVRFLELDLVQDPIPGPSELIVCSEVLYYAGDRDRLDAVARKLAAALEPGGHLLTAHARQVQDEPGQAGFDWGLQFGAKTIGEALSEAGGLRLVEETRAGLTRVQLFRRPRATESTAPAARVTEIELPAELPARVLAGVRWDGTPAPAAGAAKVATDRLPILLYHRVAASGSPASARFRVRPEAFAEQLRYLRAAGFRSATLGEWREAMERRRPLPGRRVLITFDDGYRDFATDAWPLLREHGFGALVFVVAEEVGGWNRWEQGAGERLPLLSWQELAQLREEGVELGCHSATHPFLTTLPPAGVAREAARSRAILARRLGEPPLAFAYPYGDEDPAVRHVVGGCGYAYGLNVRSRASRYTDDLLALPRMEIIGDDRLADFVAKLSGAPGAG